jgi:hypothetical protein
VIYENIDKHQKKTTGMERLPAPETGGKSSAPGQACVEKTFHDFRSSLSIIIGYSEMMLDDALGRMTEDQRDGMSDILKSSRRLLDIVNDITRRQTPSRF